MGGGKGGLVTFFPCKRGGGGIIREALQYEIGSWHDLLTWSAFGKHENRLEQAKRAYWN